MFLYARLVVDYLTSNVFYSGDEMKESVNQLPRKLAELYVINLLSPWETLTMPLATREF